MIPIKVRKKQLYSLGCLACVLFVIAICCGQSFPFSPLFTLFNSNSDSLDKALAFNRIRLRKALDYFNASKPVASEDLNAKVKDRYLDFLVVVVTVARKDHDNEPKGYLIQAAAAMDALIKANTSNSRSSLVVCNVNPDPELHTDAVFLQKYLPFFNRRASNIMNLEFSYRKDLQSPRLEDHRMARAIEDYIYCLNATRFLKSKYVIILEDDVVPLKETFNIIEHAFVRLKHGAFNGSNTILDKFAFIQLFYPQKWQGFAFDAIRIAELICNGVVIGVTLTLCYVAMYDRNASFRTHFALWTVVSIALCEIIGRVYIMELRRLSPWLYTLGPNRGCCTPAMMYPTRLVPRMMDHLLYNSTMVKDLAILDFPAKSGIPGYQLEPNVFLHTGMFTSFAKSSTDHKDPRYYLFDMPFELTPSLT